MDLAATEFETMVRMAVEDVRSHLPSVTEPVAEATVRRRIDWWRDHARVHTFVGIFAAREARAELQARAGSREPVADDSWVVADHRAAS